MPDPCSARTRTLRIISIFLPPFSLDVVRSFGHNKYPIAQTSAATTAAIAVASSGVTNGGMDEVCHLPRRGGRRDLAEAEARKARAGAEAARKEGLSIPIGGVLTPSVSCWSFSFLLLWIRISNTDQLSGGFELAPLHFV